MLIMKRMITMIKLIISPFPPPKKKSFPECSIGPRIESRMIEQNKDEKQPC